MNVKILGPAEHDRFEQEVRFKAKLDGVIVSVVITDHALFLIGEALEINPAKPLTIFAASGKLLSFALLDATKHNSEIQEGYLVSDHNILRVTGHVDGMPHVPKRWVR